MKWDNMAREENYPPFLKRRSANPSTKENKTNEWWDLRDRTQNELIADFTISLCLIREFSPFAPYSFVIVEIVVKSPLASPKYWRPTRNLQLR